MTQVDEGRRVEDAAARLNKSLLTLSRCNRVLWQARDEQEVLRSICQIFVETAGVRLAWIGYCEDDVEKSVRPVAQAGNGLDYLERVKISWGNSDAGQGPVGDAIRTGRFCWVDDIRTDLRFSYGRTEAMALGYVSCVALPLVADLGSQGLLDLRGALTLYADAFDRGEIERYADLASYLTCAVARLRSNLADDVTHGVSALRTREDRKRAQEALRERAQLLDLTHDTIFVRDMHDVITFWNRGAEELYGWKSEQAVGKVSHQLTQTIFPARLEEINAELLRTGRWDGELVHTKRDGTQVAVASRWALQRDEQGSPTAILETNNDITERKRAEKERERLLAREQAAHAKAVAAQHLVRDLVNSIEGIVWEADARTFQFLFVSQQAQRVLGYPVERWLSEPTFWKDHIHPDDREWAAAFCVAATADKRDHEFEYRMIAADGRTVWLRDLVTVVVEGDRATKLRGVMVDVTERKRAEYLTGHVFESSPDCMAIIGRDYRFQRVNPVYEQYWGVPAGRTVGMHMAEIMGRDGFEQRGKPDLDRCFAGEEVSYADWFTTPRPTYRAISVSPLRPDSQQVEAALVIARDLTDYMRAAEALREVQTELAHVNRVTTMGQLAASIAHEVSQPIAATVTNADAALRWLGGHPPDLEEVRQTLDAIIRDGNRAGDVIGRIRTLIKKVPPRYDQLDINEAILEVIEVTRSELLRSSVSLRTELANGLPLIRGDRIQLQQIVLNLIMNAVEAMSDASKGSRDLLISTAEDISNGVLVAVRDSGPGLNPESLERLFDPFYTTKPSGMGMGLSICRSIVEVHGGRIWAAANVPQGASFHFSLRAHGVTAS
jgi:PAS domain S-box-containing protein